ncbi:MAG: TolB family protein, partial [Polyangiales bacterium]
MTTPRAAPFGSWRSPITAELIVRGAKRLGDVVLDGASTWLTESRPAQRGCSVLVLIEGDAERDLTTEPFDARTRVHEYGGGSLAAAQGVAYVSNAADGRVYCVTPGTAPKPVTPPAALRYAALTVDSPRHRLIAVVEDHTREGMEPENRLVSLPLDAAGTSIVLASGADFYAAPRLSPDGSQLAYLQWHHPNMPWDGTELWVATLDTSGSVQATRRVAGGPTESIFQPEWGANGALYFVSDASGYWNLWRAAAGTT